MKAKPETIKKLGVILREIERPDLSNDEALELELVPNCRVIGKFLLISNYGKGGEERALDTIKNINGECFFCENHTVHLFRDQIIEILGLPITIPRIMYALGFTYLISGAGRLIKSHRIGSCEIDFTDLGIYLELKKENSILDATAEDQTEETAQAIIKILTNKV